MSMAARAAVDEMVEVDDADYANNTIKQHDLPPDDYNDGCDNNGPEQAAAEEEDAGTVDMVAAMTEIDISKEQDLKDHDCRMKQPNLPPAPGNNPKGHSVMFTAPKTEREAVLALLHTYVGSVGGHIASEAVLDAVYPVPIVPPKRYPLWHNHPGQEGEDESQTQMNVAIIYVRTKIVYEAVYQYTKKDSAKGSAKDANSAAAVDGMKPWRQVPLWDHVKDKHLDILMRTLLKEGIFEPARSALQAIDVSEQRARVAPRSGGAQADGGEGRTKTSGKRKAAMDDEHYQRLSTLTADEICEEAEAVACAQCGHADVLESDWLDSIPPGMIYEEDLEAGYAEWQGVDCSCTNATPQLVAKNHNRMWPEADTGLAGRVPRWCGVISPRSILQCRIDAFTFAFHLLMYRYAWGIIEDCMRHIEACTDLTEAEILRLATGSNAPRELARDYDVHFAVAEWRHFWHLDRSTNCVHPWCGNMSQPWPARTAPLGEGSSASKGKDKGQGQGGIKTAGKEKAVRCSKPHMALAQCVYILQNSMYEMVDDLGGTGEKVLGPNKKFADSETTSM